MHTRVTMRQVAKEAGVSLATVSRVLSGYPHVTSEAKAAVEKALKKLDYRPDPALRAIAACRWQGRRARSGEVIAWLDFSTKQRWKPLASANMAAAQEGYRVEHFPAARYESARKLGDVLINRGISGLVLPNTEDTPLLEGMPWERFCAVAFGVAYAHNPVDTVRFNPFETVQLGVRKLVAAGATRLGLVLLHGSQGLSATNEKMVAAFDYQVRGHRAVAPVSPLIMKIAPSNMEDTVRWWRRERPDGIIGHHDGVRSWLGVGGVRFPRDGVYLSMLRGEWSEAGAGFRQLYAECARVAVEQVMLRLRMNQRGLPAFPMDYVLSPQWMPGETCPEPAERELP